MGDLAALWRGNSITYATGRLVSKVTRDLFRRDQRGRAGPGQTSFLVDLRSWWISVSGESPSLVNLRP